MHRLIAGFALALPFALSLVSLEAQGQTCSCAAVPLLGSMQLASPNGGQWYFGTSYEFHDVSDLVAGSSSIPDRTGRDRTSQAFIIEASHGISEKWSISTITAAVSHDRQVGSAKVSTSGLSDVLVMARYSLKNISLYSDTALSFGVGARIPIGKDNELTRGVVLAEDMQPSTGAFGRTLWGYWAKALNDSRRTQIYTSVTHTFNGDNDRSYQFGNDTTITFGSALQSSGPWGINLGISYRNADRDQRNSVIIPNTGGEWLDFSVAAQYHMSESLALGIAVKVPVQRDLHDQLQFTSKYSTRLSISYVFGGR